MNRLNFIAYFTSIADRLQNGCGNHGCVINPPTGMGTNSGCKCAPKCIKRDIEYMLKEFPEMWDKK